MIDIHAHILPAIDDGAASLEDAVELARQAVADGIETVCATPHAGELSALPEGSSVGDQVELFKQALAREGVPLQLLAGLENYLAPDPLAQINAGRAATLNGSRYFLVELPLSQIPHFTEEALFQLQAGGYVPILAHPERCQAFHKDQHLLLRLVQRGILVQVTAGSLLGHFGAQARGFARHALDHRLVHFLATDMHSPRTVRRPALQAAVAETTRLVGAERARRLVDSNPRSVIDNQEVEIESPLEKGRSRWLWWKR